MKRIGRLMGLALTLMAARVLGAQEVSLQRALALERRGSWQAAADAYQELLRSLPAEVNALLGLERAFQQLGRSTAMTGAVAAALAAAPENPALYALAVRAWWAARSPDSVRALVARWAVLEPGSESPYREWGFAALAAGDRATARAAYTLGRERIGRPAAMARELAELATQEGDYAAAMPDWIIAIRNVAANRAAALSLLGQAPERARPEILTDLVRRADPVGVRLAAGLVARWGDPLRGLAWLKQALPEGATAVSALEEFLEEVRTGGSDAARARAEALERLADLSAREGSRWLVEAARAWAEAGDQVGARRVLGKLAIDPGATPDVAAAAATTLVSVLIAEGRLSEAARGLRDLEAAVEPEERARLRRELARGWLATGELERAQLLLTGDSTVEAFALVGRLRLFRGDLRGATQALVMAGPYAGERADITEGAGLLALLQVIPDDSLPALGEAFLTLARGDSARAAERFEAVGQRLLPPAGGGELALLAARVRLALGDRGAAERLFRLAAERGAPAAAAAGRLELSGLLSRSGRAAEALALLERLLLDFPDSAVAPQARRLVDAMRGGPPPS
jgi:tetratricopeptide (TPR) repeat protein